LYTWLSAAAIDTNVRMMIPIGVSAIFANVDFEWCEFDLMPVSRTAAYRSATWAGFR
jgi:hypothetical protein